MHHRTAGGKVFDVINIIFFCFFALITLYPFWSTLMVSFMGPEGYYQQMFNLYPMGFTLRAWEHIFGTGWVMAGFFNSVFYTITASFLSMFLVLTAAYGMSKQDLRGKRLINIYFLITMYFNGGLIPYYLIVNNTLSMGGTRWVMIIPFSLNVWNYLVMKNFIKNLSASLIESARIDGAKEFTILGKIVMPLSLPCISTLTMFTLIGNWNSWFQARVFLTTQEYLYPLPMVIRRIIIETLQGRRDSAAVAEMEKARQVIGQGHMIFEPARDAALVMCVVIPIVLVYPFIQKYFEKGVMIGSLKE